MFTRASSFQQTGNDTNTYTHKALHKKTPIPGSAEMGGAEKEKKSATCVISIAAAGTLAEFIIKHAFTSLLSTISFTAAQETGVSTGITLAADAGIITAGV